MNSGMTMLTEGANAVRCDGQMDKLFHIRCCAEFPYNLLQYYRKKLSDIERSFHVTRSLVLKFFLRFFSNSCKSFSRNVNLLLVLGFLLGSDNLHLPPPQDFSILAP
jgi:hypothetical protein